MKDYDSTVFFFQAEDGIRDLVRSRGLGDVYKRQIELGDEVVIPSSTKNRSSKLAFISYLKNQSSVVVLSLIHI